MNWDRIAGNWQSFKGSARQRWGRLTGDHAGIVAGLRQRTLGRTRSDYALTARDNERQLAEWRERQHKVDPIHK
jgi:uncharacterized protein YjbJ (UPF0337 family)